LPLSVVPPEVCLVDLPQTHGTRPIKVFGFAVFAFCTALASFNDLGPLVTLIVVVSTIGFLVLLAGAIRVVFAWHHTVENPDTSVWAIGAISTALGPKANGQIFIDHERLCWVTTKSHESRCRSFAMPVGKIESARVSNGSVLRLTSALEVTVGGRMLRFMVGKFPGDLRRVVHRAIDRRPSAPTGSLGGQSR
jgi:hypothetical protein